MAAAEKSIMPPWSREFSHPESSSPDPSSSCSRSAWAGLTFVSEETHRAGIKNKSAWLLKRGFSHYWRLTWWYGAWTKVLALSCYVVEYHLSVTFSTVPQPAPPVSRSWVGCACCRELQSWSLGDPAAAWGPRAGEGLWSPHCIHLTMSGQRPTEGWGDRGRVIIV